MNHLSKITERIELACQEVTEGKEVKLINQEWKNVNIRPDSMNKLELASKKYNVPKDLVFKILKGMI